MVFVAYYYASLCMGGSKGKTEVKLKHIPENRDRTEMLPGKVIYMICG